MKWNIPKVGGTSSPSPNITTSKKWNIPTLTTPKVSTPIPKEGFIGRPAVTQTERVKMAAAAQQKSRVTPALYNPAIIPTFNKQGKAVKDVGEYKKGLLTGLDYFNRYTETALGTLGAVAETAGFAIDKDTWGIFTDKMKQMYSQIWSPPALEEKDAAKAVGRAAGNALSLAGTAIVMWQIGTAVAQTAKQVQLNNRRIAYAKSQLPKEGTVAGLEGGGVGKLSPVKVGDLGATKAEEASWVTYATQNLGMTKAQAHESLSLMKEVASSPYAQPTATTYGSAAKEPGFGIGQSYPSHVVSTVTQAVEGLPAGQNIVLNFITENPSAAVRMGVVSNAREVTTLANLVKAVNAGQATVAGLQTAMQSSIPSLGVLAHYADLTREPIEKVMAEQFNLAVPVGQAVTATPAKPITSLAEIPKAVPVGQPQTVSGGVKPHRYQIPNIKLALPAPAITSNITAPSVVESDWGERSGTTGLRTTTHEIVYTTREGVQKKGILVEDASGNLYGISKSEEPTESSQISPAVAISEEKASVPTPPIETAQQIAPVAEVAPTVSKREIPPILSTRDSLIGYHEPISRKGGPDWELVDFDKDGSPLWTDRHHPIADRTKVKLWQDATWVNEQLSLRNRTPEQIARDEAQRTIDNKKAAEIISGAFNTPSTEQPSAVPAKSVKWGKWIEAVGTRRTSGVGTGQIDTIKTPITYRFASGETSFQKISGNNMRLWETVSGKSLQLKGDPHAYYLYLDHPSPSVPAYAVYRVIEARSGYQIGEGDSAKNAIGKAQETITAHKEELDIAIENAVKKNQGEANPSVTNTAPLPAGLTSSGEAVTPTYTSNEPNLSTSGTSQTIPATKDDIARITMAFDDVVKAKREGKLVPATEGTYQKVFEDALKAAGVPKGALNWKDAIQYYKQSKGRPSLEVRLAKVAKAVEKYNNSVLGEKIGKIADKRAAARATKEAIAAVKEQSEEQIAENGRVLLEKAKKAVEGQKFGDQIELAKAKAHADAILAAVKQRAINQAKTIEWMKAEADRKARQKTEVDKLKKGINAISMKATPAEEARGIQVATAGVKGAEKIFEKPSSTQFAFLAEEKGLHVEQRPEQPEPREVDLPELRKIAARVKALRDLGLEKKDALQQARRESIMERSDAVTAQILTSVKPTSIPDIGKEVHTLARPNKAKELIQWIADAKGRKVWQFQELDGFKRGVITKTLYDDALSMENAVRSSDRLLSERIKERLSTNGITEKSYNAERTLPNGQVLTQAQVLLVAVNSLNTDNLYHLMAGNGYSEETIAQAIRSMTKEEVDTANMILDSERGAWPAVNAAYEYTHNGESLPELENFVHIELQHSDEIGQPEGKSAEELIHQDVLAQGWVQNATSKGWEKQRVPQSSVPLREDPIATFISYIKQTTDFIGRERVAQDILQIVKDVHVKDAYMLRAGHEGYTSLLSYAQDLANPAGALGLQAVAPKGRKFEKLLRDSRLASSCSILALRISKMVTAGASYVTSAGQVGPETMLYGTAKLISNPKQAMRTIKEFMPILYDRIIDPVRIEAEVSMLEKSWEKGRSKLRDWENVTFRIADTADIASEALGGLARAQREHPEWSLEKAAYEIQRMVLATHSSDIVEDKPDIYKLGEVARVITAFTGEATAASDYLNYLGRGSFKGKIPKHRFFRQALFTIVGVALIMRLAAKVSQGKKKDPKKDMWYNTWWGYSLMSLIENAVPIVGRYITQGLQGITWASAPVALKPLEVVKNIFAAIAQGNMKDVAAHVAELAGYLTAAPVEGVNEAIRWLTPTPTTTQTGPTRLPSLPKRPSLPKSPKP